MSKPTLAVYRLTVSLMEPLTVITGIHFDQKFATNSLIDIAIVGSGISGTLAATVLGRAGFRICLIDRYAVYPKDFRAEHLDGPQIDQLRRLGLLENLTAGLYRGESVAIARAGRITGSAYTVNFGQRYESLVNRARSNLPHNVDVLTGRVTDIETSGDTQQVRLADGRSVHTRLVVLATGQGYSLCKQVGVQRRVVREAHSLTFGFDIEPVRHDSFKHSFLVYQPERTCDRMDYLSLFALGTTTRANLFCYRDYREQWTKDFMTDPNTGLAAVLPGLTRVIGQYRAMGPVVARPMDLYVSEQYQRDGVVLIGDAFQASCPATGMGMVRLLTDIERLSTVHVPQWLQSPGMGAAKIASFYDDPVKVACDAQALHDAEYRRLVSTKTTLGWRMHRLRVHAVERLRWWHAQLAKPVHAHGDAPDVDTSLAAT